MLNREIEENIRSHSTQLAENKKELVEKTYSRPLNQTKNIVSFYFDDGVRTDLTLIKPIADAKGIPLTIACICNGIYKSAITIEEMLQLQSQGWEINSHTYDHIELDTLTEEQVDYQLRMSKEYFESRGVKVNSLCYPVGKFNETVMKVARKYYRSGLATIQDINSIPINTYHLNRIILDSYDLPALKARVDSLNNQWIIFYSHSGQWSQTDVDKFSALIDYVKSKNISITTVDKALDIFENKFEVGDSFNNQSYFKVGANGKVDSAKLNYEFLGSNSGVKNDTSITSFPKFKVSICSFNSAEASGIQLSSGIGTLKTYRIHADDNINFQEFHPYDGSCMAKRYWNNTNKVWGSWIKFSNDNNVPSVISASQLDATVIKNSTPITSFPANKISYVTFTSGQSDVPYNNSIGTLVTFRLSSEALLGYQEWQGYNSSDFYRRNWTSSGWGEWKKFSPSQLKLSTSTSNPFGTVNANSSAIFDINIVGLSTTSTVNVTFITELPTGIICQTSVPSTDTLRIKLYNVTSSNITCGTRGFYVVQI